jgi:hypothetical protein
LNAELPRGDPFVALRVLVHDGVHALRVGAAGLAEGHVLARDVLEFDRDVFEHVAQPGTLALTQAPDQSARLPVRASVLRERGQRRDQRIDECGSQAAARPFLERPQIEQQLDDREVRVHRRTHVDVAFEDAHRYPFLQRLA